MQYDLLQGEVILKDTPHDGSIDSTTPSSHKKTSNDILSPCVANKPHGNSDSLPAAILSALDPNTPESEFTDDMDHKMSDRAANDKAPDALKTIGEAAQILGVPQHVLRFWESRFSQIKPVKSRGGRRYYRPEDIKVLTMVQHLLYKQGYTIKGAKKAFQEMKKSKQQAGHAHPLSINSSDFPLDGVVRKVKTHRNLSAEQVGKINHIRGELSSLRDSLKSLL